MRVEGVETKKEAIVCPNCASIQSAEAFTLRGKWIYVHNCKCGYRIWDWVRAKPQIWEGKRTVRQIEVQGQLRTFNF